MTFTAWFRRFNSWDNPLWAILLTILFGFVGIWFTKLTVQFAIPRGEWASIVLGTFFVLSMMWAASVFGYAAYRMLRRKL